MASHKVLIGGTAYEITGGRTLIKGTGYDIAMGRTLVGGTGYDIPFIKWIPCHVTNTSQYGGQLHVNGMGFLPGHDGTVMFEEGEVLDLTSSDPNFTVYLNGELIGTNTPSHVEGDTTYTVWKEFSMEYSGITWLEGRVDIYD